MKGANVHQILEEFLKLERDPFWTLKRKCGEIMTSRNAQA